ncbi:MAG: S9 family peptidase [Pseudomonadota bacterium]
MRWMGIAAFALAGLHAAPAAAQSADAQRFGVREAVEQISLSPDGTHVVFLAPGKGPETVAYVAEVEGGKAPLRLFASDGRPETVRQCRWASNARIICRISMLLSQEMGLVGYTRLISVSADGKDAKLLTARTSPRSLGVAQGGGEVIDWLPDADGDVLMSRTFVPETDIGTLVADTRRGYGVERVDTATLKRSTVEAPKPHVVEFITDGYGTVRVMGSMGEGAGNFDTGIIRYFYRAAGSRDWQPLGTFEVNRDTGFNPYAVDRDLNAVYGFEKQNGRQALYRVALDGSMKRELVYARDDVDVDGLVRIGRRQRVVGASYVTDRRVSVFFDPVLKALAASLSRALPGLPLIQFVDSSTDENRLLLWAGSDVDPGRYYVFDRKAKKVMEIMLSRPQLEGTALSPVKPVTFTAGDGTRIPAYLTLPRGSDGPGKINGGLPAIVMPHGGPGARDEWGFDWLAQFFAARGFAVLQPNFRGSTGYGDAWFQQNGFRSWRTAIGDVNDGGRWLVSQGIAAPDKLAIVGWSYGGYAALQSAVMDPALFKAIVAIAPVTDLDMLKEEARWFTNFRIVRDAIGTGPHIAEGSPARNAARITAPVLLFHGDHDVNVGIAESRVMASRLREAHKRVELVEFPDLDHQLHDSQARAGMLDKADTFLRSAMGMAPGAK